MMGELTGADIIGEPVYDSGTAAGMAIRMASRITGRNEVIVPANMSPDRLSIIRTFCQPEIMDNSIKVRKVGYNGETGCIDMDQLKKMISDKTAAVYFEMPGYLGVLEENAEEICTIAGNCGAVNIVGVDPISLRNRCSSDVVWSGYRSRRITASGDSYALRRRTGRYSGV